MFSKDAPHQVYGAALVGEIFGTRDLAVPKIHVVSKTQRFSFFRDATSHPQGRADKNARSRLLNIQDAFGGDQKDVLTASSAAWRLSPSRRKKSPDEVVVIIEHPFQPQARRLPALQCPFRWRRTAPNRRLCSPAPPMMRAAPYRSRKSARDPHPSGKSRRMCPIKDDIVEGELVPPKGSQRAHLQ